MTINATAPNADFAELAKFSAQAQSWWDPKGPSKPLHDLNPLRLRYIERLAPLAGRTACDVGCGGGILAESLARAGAKVVGIDLSAPLIEVARLHALESAMPIDYRIVPVADLARERPASFDLICCMEMLEHVPEPASVLMALSQLVKPRGDIVVSTLNRNPKSFASVIIGAEYLTRMLPRGTHEYLKFIRPSELAAWGREAGLELCDLRGIAYNPLTRAFRLAPDTSVNYLAHFRHADAD